MVQVIATFRYDAAKTVGLIAAGIILVGGCVTILTVIPNPGTKGLIAAYFGIPFFGGATILIIARLFQAGPVVEVSTSGIRCRRWPRNFDVPWTAIANMSVRTMRRRRFLVLQLRPQEPSGPASRTISMMGLDGSFDDLLAAIKTARPPGSGQQPRFT